ncbi:Telomerase catalytic subunit/reverse transcriptase TERT [Handroanthus impetiginosus]|uniref:Telomerase reverse transcriptase n=1 Tax=Handroanthus impetiginosus TaxID=429701 RepID=A0A2G9I2A4_9LAMI|nr:Telomerase catalytic subunit/reverse transcriptase TERT [Handroanthus impetiginosus]
MARKQKRVPVVLWRLFRDRARSLADTILALIPSSPATADGCRCRGRRCLSCSGDEAMSFLVRPDDPSDYRKLLTGCYVVVSENAPSLLVVDPNCRWSQREIVRRSIEMIMSQQPSSSNLICCGYDKSNRSSDVVDALTSSTWTILLRRVGDALMMYLLRYSSLFLSLPRKKYHQIAGFPISDLCLKLSRHIPDPNSQQLLLLDYGSRKKRKRLEEAESIPRKQRCTYSLGSEPPSNSIKSVGSDGSSCLSNEGLSHKSYGGSLKQSTVSGQKRTRQYRWQRQRKRRQLAVQGECSLIPCTGNRSNKDNLPGGLQTGISASCKNDGANASHCFCCSVFKNVLKMNKNSRIDRRNIFYRLENSTSVLPRKHILYTLKPNASGASVLLNNIFGTFGVDKNPGAIPCLHSENSCLNVSTCLYHSLTKLLKSLIRKTQNCQYLRLLDKHCSEMISEASVDHVEPCKYNCPKKQVVSFIWAVCRRIVPSAMLGEPSNWRILRTNIAKFIQLRKFEKFSLKECIHKLKVSKFHLLSNKNSQDMHNRCRELGITDTVRHAILERWIFWFFAHLVSPIVQANFYVTESEHKKLEVLYYRKPTWEKLMREAECMNDHRYCLLNHESTRKILGKRSFGFSRARLRPKKIGFRMLTNLQAPSRMPLNPPPSRIHTNNKLHRKARNHQVTYQFFKSVNSVLHDLHVVVKGSRKIKPEKLSSSVFDYNDVYRKFLPFLFLLKNGSTNTPSVFIVVSDVSKAFDSINQDKLLSVMKDVLLDDEYTLEKFTQVCHTKKSLKVHQYLTLAHQEIGTASSRIKSSLHGQSLDSVLVKKSLSRKTRKEELKLLLEEHITRNVVQLGNNFYLQRVGIPQGSVLSSLLCSFYYGDMERNVLLPFLEKASENLLREYDNHAASASRGNHTREMLACGSEYLLLRFIDDFLFISTSKKQASMFFSRLERGIRDYNCRMNEEKYGLNFIMNDGQECRSNRLHVGKDGVSFLRWSGLLVNCSTLEIQADYTRYQNSHLSTTLTVSCQGKVSRQLKAKLRTYLRPKCHPIFYDSNINTPGIVRLNIYQAFLLCAMKFICYISNLSILPRFTPQFYVNAIYASLRYMNTLIKRKMYSFEVVDSAFRPKYDVKKKEVIWLGLYAYSRVIKKKQSRHKELLRLFMHKLREYGKVGDLSSELKYATDDAHSSVLWSIKY